eukprot:1385801-Rhodomonas_salina.1
MLYGSTVSVCVSTIQYHDTVYRTTAWLARHDMIARYQAYGRLAAALREGCGGLLHLDVSANQ